VLVGPDLATSYAERSLSVAREIGDPEVLARGLHELGESVQAQGDYVRAKTLFREAIAAAHETGHTGAGSVANLGDVALMEGDFAEAVARSTEAAELFRAEGSIVGIIVAQFNLSSALFHQGRLDEARAPLRQALRAASDVGYNEIIAWCLLATAAMLARRAPVEDAGRLLGSAEAILDEIGSPLGASEQRLHDVVTETLDAQSMSLGEAGRQLGRDDAVALAFQYLD
jgi:tetratricopeptide (TPR) repeat protein